MVYFRIYEGYPDLENIYLIKFLKPGTYKIIGYPVIVEKTWLNINNEIFRYDTNLAFIIIYPWKFERLKWSIRIFL